MYSIYVCLYCKSFFHPTHLRMTRNILPFILHFTRFALSLLLDNDRNAMTDNNDKIEWNDVFSVAGFIIMAIFVIMRKREIAEPWFVYSEYSLMAAYGVGYIVYAIKCRKGRKRVGNILWGILCLAIAGIYFADKLFY